MSTQITLGGLRSDVGSELGEGVVTGTFSSNPSGSVQDNNRYDLDRTWANGWLQDTTVPGGQIIRIQSWTQANTTFTFWGSLPGTCKVNDSYEVHKTLSFDELRRAINDGIGMCGEGMRFLVRDESQVLVAGQYQYQPNYNSASPNAFWPAGVMSLDVQVDTGQPTAPWLPIENFAYIDDYVLQLGYADVDAYAGNPIRFTGYGPIGQPLLSDDPAQVIATFTDDFNYRTLVHACTYYAWTRAAAKKSSGESKEELAMASVALQEFTRLSKNWFRPQIIKRGVILPTAPGWSAGTRSR